MKIAILSFYSGMNMRGVERWVADLSSRLSYDHKVTVFQNKPLNEKVAYEIISSNIDYREPKMVNKLLKLLFLDYKSLKVLRFNIKIIKNLFLKDFDFYLPTDGGWEPAIIRLVSWFRRKKMLIVGHAGVGWDDANNLWSLPDKFVAISSHAAGWAKRVNPFVKTVYIPDAVDTDKFKTSGNKKDLGFPNNYPAALCVGALEAGKRIELVIDAVSNTDDLNLLVVGRGGLKEQLLKIGKEKLADRFAVKEYGMDEMPSVYRSCDIFISASLPHYSFEIVILEALASGLWVVANDDAIRKEIVGEAGILTKVSDIHIFSEAIRSALKKKGTSVPVKQAERFSWNFIYPQYLEVFKTLLK